MLVKRKKIFDSYSRGFSKFKWAELPEYKNKFKTTSYHIFLLRIKDITEQQRDKIIHKIFEKEVSVNVHFVPLPMMTFYKKAGYRIEDYPVSYDTYSREISLPVYYDLSEKQVQMVIKAVIDSVKEVIG